jgi:hypothetical protein
MGADTSQTEEFHSTTPESLDRLATLEAENERLLAENKYRLRQYKEQYKEWEEAEEACRAANLRIKEQDTEILKLATEIERLRDENEKKHITIRAEYDGTIKEAWEKECEKRCRLSKIKVMKDVKESAHQKWLQNAPFDDGGCPIYNSIVRDELEKMITKLKTKGASNAH